MKSLKDELLPEKKREDLPGEHPGEEAIRKTGDMMEAALASLGHQEVDMEVEINFLSERLDDGHHPWAKLSAGCGLEVFTKPTLCPCPPGRCRGRVSIFPSESQQPLTAIRKMRQLVLSIGPVSSSTARKRRRSRIPGLPDGLL